MLVYFFNLFLNGYTLINEILQKDDENQLIDHNDSNILIERRDEGSSGSQSCKKRQASVKICKDPKEPLTPRSQKLRSNQSPTSRRSSKHLKQSVDSNKENYMK